MGIKGLRPFLLKLNPNVFRKVHLSAFKGTRIAIDVAFWLHQNVNSVYSRLAEGIKLDDQFILHVPQSQLLIDLFRKFINFITTFLNETITPLCIFDGDHPKLKGIKYERQRPLKENNENKLDALKFIALNANGEFDQKMIEGAIAKIHALQSQNPDVSTEDYEQIASWIRQLGLPYFCAKQEAEGLASYLCIDGVVSAVYSKDTDTMVYGCPRSIFSIDSEKNVELMEIYPILQTIALPFDRFQDFCILCETDFNTRIPNLGEKKIYAVMKELESIDLFLLLANKAYRQHPTYLQWCEQRTPLVKKAWTVLEKAGQKGIDDLHIAENRDIFKYRKGMSEVKMGHLEMQPVAPSIRSTLRMLRAEALIDSLLAAMVDLPPPTDMPRWYPGKTPQEWQ